MNLLERVKTMVDGVKNLTLWVGSGGEVVAPEVAQARAEVCLNCPHNLPGMVATREVAEATLKFLEFKNSLKLDVAGEEDLHSCATCGCVLPLLIWEPDARVAKQMTPEEIKSSPEECWKLKTL